MNEIDNNFLVGQILIFPLYLVLDVGQAWWAQLGGVMSLFSSTDRYFYIF